MKQNSALIFMLMLAAWLSGCASEMADNETIERIRNEIRRPTNPLQIQESRKLQAITAGAVYDNKANPASTRPPVFEAEYAKGGVVNPNAGRPQRPAPNSPGTVTLNFENADLREVVKFVMTDLLKQNYILSPAVNGQVTLQTSEPIPTDSLLSTLETLLKINGAVIVNDGDLIRIVPVTEANRGLTVPKVGKLKRLKPGYEVRIIPLKYISVVEAQKNIEPFLPAGSLLQVDPIKNIMTVAGTSNELANIQQTIDTFDVDWLKGMSIGVYRLQNVSLDEVMPEIEGLFGAGSNTPFAGLFKFVPMQRMNSVMVITRQANYLGEARRWLETLDKSQGEEQERLYVYRVQNGRAEDLAGVLSGIFTSASKGNNATKSRAQSVAPRQQGATATSTPNANKGNNLINQQQQAQAAQQAQSTSVSGGTTISGAEATISADTINNSLVIKATPGNYDLVLQALRQLDVPKLQVMLDVVVAEIQLTGSLNLGFKYWLQEAEKNKNYQGITAGGVGAANINDITSGFSYTLNNLLPGRLNLAINALAENGLAQFLSTPSLMVLDNETASMNVGEKISISNNYTDANGNAVNGTSYLNTGVNLNITPRVTAGGNVQMNVSQSVSRQSASAGVGGNPNVFNRDITSVVVAKDGQTIVLGGLIQENTDSVRAGLPVLKDLPVVGSMFRNTARSKNRSELIVLITPHVARNAEDTLRITKEFRARMQGLDIYNETREKYQQ